MTVTTVDLDDTLIVNKVYYDKATERFVHHMEEKHGLDPDVVKDTLREIDRDRLEHMGLSKERFPTSFAKTVDELLENPTDEQRQQAKEMGYSAFLTEEEYAEEGFRDGATEMLDHLVEHAHELHLLTAGDPEVQKPKINALDLDRWFDEIHIVEMHGKSDILGNLVDEHHPHRNVVHIGNSESSDVKPAIEVGARAVYLPRNQWRGTSDVDYTVNPDVSVFDSIHDYTDILREQNSIFQQ